MAKASVTVALGADAGEFADAMDAAALSYKEFNDVLKAGKATFDATRTNAEKYEAEIAKLDHQLRAGAISQDTYNRAVKNAGSAFAGSPFKAGAGQVQELTGAIGQAVPQIGQLTSKLGALGPAGAAIAIGFAAASAPIIAFKAALELTVDQVSKALDRIGKLDDAAKVIGVSTQSLSELRYAAAFAGVGTEGLDKSLGKMLKTVGTAAMEGGKAEDAFKRLGLSSRELSALDADQQFEKIIDALNGIENPAQRAAAASDIFGKSWQDIAPLIDSGVGKLREAQEEARLFGQSISAVDAAHVAEAGDQIDKIKLAIEGAANAATVQLAPAITAVTKVVVELIKETDAVNKVGQAFGLIASNAEIAAASLLPVIYGMIKLQDLISGEDSFQALNDLIESERRLRKMESDRAEAQRKARQGIDDEAEKNKKASDEAEQAAKRLADLMEKIKFDGATAGFSEAEKKLQELADAGASADQLIEANAALAAQAAAKDAEAALKKANDDKEKAIKKAEDDKKKLADMLAKAEKEGRQASMTDVEKKLDDLRSAGASQAELDAAKPMLEAVEAAKDAEKAQEKVRKEQEKFASDAEKLAESLRTPQEKYNDAVAEADKMRNAGLLDAAQHTKALAKAQADYNAELEKTNKPIGALEKGSAAAFSAIEAARRNAAKQVQPQGLFPPGFQGQPQPQGLFPPGFPQPKPPKNNDPFTVGGGKGGGVGAPPKQPDDLFTVGGGKGGIDPNDLKKLAPPAPVVMPPAMPPMPSDPLARRAAEEAAKASKAVDDMRRRRGLEPRPQPMPVELPPSDEVPMPPMMPEPPGIDTPPRLPQSDLDKMRFKRLGDKPEMPEPRNPPGMDAAGTKVESSMQREDPTLKKLDENTKRAAAAAETANKLLAEMVKRRGAKTASFN